MARVMVCVMFTRTFFVHDLHLTKRVANSVRAPSSLMYIHTIIIGCMLGAHTRVIGTLPFVRSLLFFVVVVHFHFIYLFYLIFVFHTLVWVLFFHYCSAWHTECVNIF